MKILRYLFINLLIILAPIYGNWDLISKGERCQGTVFEIKEMKQDLFYETYSQIIYRAGDNSYTIQGPENVEYPIGSKLELIYPHDKPSEAIIYSVSGFLSQWYTIMAFVLFILWNAFYLSFLRGKPKYGDSYTTNKNQLNK
ncbi:DUF3592 domain-containing protein [Ancylomarina sp. 16SWW S1-10-2]|uniref:DUF3592 domain-containing protein n=1 Tax=Ancylomarina sp. 16SWW S1-10-2 TaxID=2499681 RepID=UPI0012ADFB11|nr:DUF3592 domain-containing protein [Ancylomarina sp. 16SWW S1-10-2]MRT92854.1 hypothetical protein [Ancylomarina sp. 16SWW S1-10-2]